MQIRGIIVENTFTSMEDLVKHLSPAFSKYMVRAMTNKWDTLSIIGNISKPMLLLSGRADEIVPPRMMTALYKAAILSQGRELAAFPKVCQPERPPLCLSWQSTEACPPALAGLSWSRDRPLEAVMRAAAGVDVERCLAIKPCFFGCAEIHPCRFSHR